MGKGMERQDGDYLGCEWGDFPSFVPHGNRANLSRWEQTPLPSRHLLFHMRSNADVAPSARPQVVRGAVAASMVAFWRLVSSHAKSLPSATPFAVQTRPPCALLPLSGQPRPDVNVLSSASSR